MRTQPKNSILTSGAFADSPEEALDCACLPAASGVPSPRRNLAGMMTLDRPEIVTTRVTLKAPRFCNRPLQCQNTSATDH
jgi:hypothetical protein